MCIILLIILKFNYYRADENINILLAEISVRDGEKGSSSTSRRV